MDLVPIRMVIKYSGGGFVYPDFDNAVPAEDRFQLPFSKMPTIVGGPHYDKPCGFGQVDEYNDDPMTYFAAMLVPPEFAIKAVDEFPDTVSVMTEAEFATFHDDRAHAHEPAERIDADVLTGIRARYGIRPDVAVDSVDRATLTADERQALDPDHPAPGIRKNKEKRWADRKLRCGITIDEATVAKLKR